MGPHKKGAGAKSCILQNVGLSTDTKKSHFGHIPPGANSKSRPVFQKTGAFSMEGGSVGCGMDIYRTPLAWATALAHWLAPLHSEVPQHLCQSVVATFTVTRHGLLSPPCLYLRLQQRSLLGLCALKLAFESQGDCQTIQFCHLHLGLAAAARFGPVSGRLMNAPGSVEGGAGA